VKPLLVTQLLAQLWQLTPPSVLTKAFGGWPAGHDGPEKPVGVDASDFTTPHWPAVTKPWRALVQVAASPSDTSAWHPGCSEEGSAEQHDASAAHELPPLDASTPGWPVPASKMMVALQVPTLA
jgi:hypothetical protein